METQSGVYEILNTANGKRYIGSAIKFQRRFNEHRRRLRANSHHSPKLQCAWNKYGEEAFKFIPILTCQKSMLLFYEQQLLDKVKPEYNIAIIAGAPTRGRRLSDEHKAKIGAAGVGRAVSSATRQLLSAQRKGVPLSEAHREKLSIVRRGKKRGPHSAATKAKIGAKHRGKTISPEAIERNRAAHIGKKRGPQSAEHRKNISTAITGRVQTLEARANMATAKRGRPLSEAHRLSIIAGKAAAKLRRRVM